MLPSETRFRKGNAVQRPRLLHQPALPLGPIIPSPPPPPPLPPPPFSSSRATTLFFSLLRVTVIGLPDATTRYTYTLSTLNSSFACLPAFPSRETAPDLHQPTISTLIRQPYAGIHALTHARTHARTRSPAGCLTVVNFFLFLSTEISRPFLSHRPLVEINLSPTTSSEFYVLRIRMT